MHRCIVVYAIFSSIVWISTESLFINKQINRKQYPQEDIGLEIHELVTKYGYPFENHSVTTEDGYILQLHRIPFGLNSTTRSNRPPVLITHGQQGNSILWLLSGTDKALPYYLAENGYDVWLANMRGTTYARKHRKLNPDTNSKEFFNFSYNELGIFDLPASIDYTLNITGTKKIYYIGHSQGCMTLFVLLSERPEYNDKIKLMLALAPVVYTKNTNFPYFLIAAAFQNLIEWGSEYFNIHEFKPRVFDVETSIQICRDGSLLQWFCSFLGNINSGFNDDKVNKTRLSLFYSHLPGGSSVKEVLHYAQVLNTDVLKKYDYGENKNIEIYGQSTPPLYNLKNVKIPVAIFYGNNDIITNEQVIKKLVADLPNVVSISKPPDEKFTHFDFFFSIHAIDILYPQILDIMNKYNEFIQ